MKTDKFEALLDEVINKTEIQKVLTTAYDKMQTIESEVFDDVVKRLTVIIETKLTRELTEKELTAINDFVAQVAPRVQLF